MARADGSAHPSIRPSIRPSIYLPIHLRNHLPAHPPIPAQVHDDGLYSISIEQQGSLLCTGSVDGSVYLLELSEGLTTLQRNEKPQITSMFERESKREKNLDARAKELRISKAKEAKAAEAAAKEENLTARELVGTPWEVKAKEVEDEFWKAVGDFDGV